MSDTGSSSSDKITSNDALTGSGDANAVVHFTVDGTLIASTATANASGVWSYTPTGLADGSHTIVASETNAGGTGTASLTFTLDTAAPTVAITNTGGLTNHAAQMVSGTVDLADVGTVVTVYDRTTVIGTATVQSNGSWTDNITLTGDGSHTLTAKDTDVAGNIGTSNAITFTLDTTAPTVVISSTGGLTTHAAQTVQGTVDLADVGTVVTVYDGTNVLGTATVQSNGNWTDNITLTGNGIHTLTAHDSDAAGNTGISNSVQYTLVPAYNDFNGDGKSDFFGSMSRPVQYMKIK